METAIIIGLIVAALLVGWVINRKATHKPIIPGSGGGKRRKLK